MKIIGWERKGNVVMLALGKTILMIGQVMIGMMRHMNITPQVYLCGEQRNMLI